MLDNQLYKALNIQSDNELKNVAKILKIPLSTLKYYAERNIFPSEADANKMCEYLGIDILELQLKLGSIDYNLLKKLMNHSKEIRSLIEDEEPQEEKEKKSVDLVFTTDYGKMYKGDCISLMQTMESNSVDLIFADPPFNLDKQYESGYNDKVSEQEYLQWTEQWLLECVRILKDGGAMFVWNLPKWNTYISTTLNRYLEFRHWIAVDIKYRLPIKNRLYPSHYGLLYYIKGSKPNSFNESRLPLEICRHCAGDIHDYGGYKDKLNEKGINLTDVWDDIPPVRHSKYKTRGSNELSLKLLERIISLASNEGDTVFDPFGGSGTTYIASEILKRKWIGIEIGPTEAIKQRFEDIEWQREYIKDLQSNSNVLFTEKIKKKRIANGHWTPETIGKKKEKQQSLKI
ncbi:site-specific DNA-methyltransferase [Domibacillus antri]|uniref:Site-specific DNA-methyltransferase n=1 Tax=Domibacillus antri TaxID=1714264 RepID=A0A1Q8Q1Y4_9BACI|nr:site-specific DNA-methyltransferase [Domibacillus antri]OLN21332.1 site-specific DNA-methyltransferase [Domibacillus antri]